MPDASVVSAVRNAVCTVCSCVLWVVGAQGNRESRTEGVAGSRTLQEGPSVCCGLAVSLGRPRVPHCR